MVGRHGNSQESIAVEAGISLRTFLSTYWKQRRVRGEQMGQDRKSKKAQPPKPTPSDITPPPQGSITSPNGTTNWESTVQILWEAFLIHTTTRVLKRKSGHVFKRKDETGGF